MAKKPSRYVDPQAPLDNNNLPVTSYGSVDPSSIPNFSKSYSEQPNNIADTGTASYVGDQFERNSLDDANVYQSDLPNLEDERASNQSTIGALGDATAKFLGKTIVSTAGNLIGTVYGVGAAIGEGKLSDIWDNSFMNAVDTADKGLDNFFKVYKNADYQDQNILQKLFLHPTQFTDEATDTASFMAGAILSEIATSGIASETIVPKALKYMKYLSEGAEATEATKALTSLATKGITLAGDLGTSVKHLAMGASYEGIVEARQATMELREKMLSDYEKDHPNQDIPQNVKDDIDDRLSKAGLFTYLSNLALVGGTNLLLFPKLFGLGHETSKIAAGAIEKDAETGLYKAANNGKHSLLDNITTGLTKPVEESTKFGIQGTISKTAREFYDRKNDPDSKKDVGDFLSTFATQLADTYTSKEGWNNIGMGMIIGALGAPGRGILAPLGPDHVLGKYGYKDVTDADGNITGKEKLPMWQGGVAGSFQERAEKDKQIAKVLADLNEHTSFFKAMKANYDTMVENNSLQKDQDKALQDGDVFNFQNTRDDQIHSYVSARIKNNLYDDLVDEASKMKNLHPDEFYTNFKGEEASNQATNIEKTKFQQETVNNFLERAKNTRDAIKIADDVYKGDNDDLREHLVHSIVASKNLDLRERLINQSLADLSYGSVSNLNALGTNTIKDHIEDLSQHLSTLDNKEETRSPELDEQLSNLKQAPNKNLTPEEHNMMSRFADTNPTAFALNRDKIESLLEDSRKLRAKRQDYLDVYNHLFTQEGQNQFNKAQQDHAEAIQKQQDLEQQKVEDKQKEDIKKQNIKDTVTKAKDITNSPEVVDQLTADEVNNTPTKTTEFVNLEDDLVDEGTKEAPESTISPEPITNTTEVTNAPVESNLTPEETAIVKIENNKEVKANREVALSDTGLVRNTSVEHFDEIFDKARLINQDQLRIVGNTISYLGIDKVTYGRLNADKDVEIKTFDIFDDNGNIEVNKFVEPKLFSQNYYAPGTSIELSVPTYSEMEERGLQNYSSMDYNNHIDDVDQFPIAIKGEDGKIIGYLPTKNNIINRVAEEFRSQALQDNAALREYIFDNKDKSFKSTITSKSTGWVITDLKERQKSLYEAFGDKSKLADKVSLGIVKPLDKDVTPNANDLYTDNSRDPFSKGTIINGAKLQSGVVYAILPTAVKDSYVVAPTKVNKIGINNGRTIVEALKLFANKDNLSATEKESVKNIGEFNFQNFKDVSNFVNRIMYGSSKADASEDTVFKLHKDHLYLSSLEGANKYSLADIASNKAVQEEIANILSERYFSIKLENLNTKNSYVSYNLDDNGIVQEKIHNSYQDYLNDQKAITSNVRGVHISGNEYAFTAQSVIGISNSVEKEVTQLPEHQEAEVIESKDNLTEETKEATEAPEEKQEAPKRMTKRKLNVDPNKLKGDSLEDINPQKNFSVMDKLFVDLDKFTDSQQREVVDSIIYTLEEGKSEGYSTVEELFQYAKDVFANTKDYFAELNDDNSFDSTIQKFNDIDQNWDKFKEKTLDKLKGIGIKITKTFETNISGEAKSEETNPDLEVVESNSPEESFVSTEATYQKDFYLDSDQTSTKDTASAHLKLKLSLIPEVELIDGKLEPTTNFLGMGKMMDLNKVWTSLQGVLTGLETDQIYPMIEELAKSNPMYSTVLSNIKNDPSTNIQNEFVVAFSKQQKKPLTVKIGYADKASKRTINVFGTNRQGANDILVANWYDRFKNSPYVQDNGVGNLVVNSERGKQAYDAFTKFISNYNPKDINLAKNLQTGLASVGINLSLPTLDNLIKHGTFVDRTKYSGKDFLNKYIGLIYKRLAAGFTPKENLIGDSAEDDSTALALNNPFISETKALTVLAKLENITNPFLYESSYIGGDGKSRYSIANNTYLSKFFNRLNSDKFEQFLQDKLSTTYAANSIWGNKLLTDNVFKSNFSYHDVDSLGSNETNSSNKVFSKMNTKEKEFFRIAQFQNVGRNTSIFLAPIPSDKSTIPAIQASRIEIKIDINDYRVTNLEAREALYAPFIAEYNRIKDVQAQQEDLKFKDKLLQGYHFGMGEKFLIYDFLNKNKELFDENGKLKIVDPQTLRSVITPEIQKFTTEMIKKQLTYWNKLGLFEKDSPLYDKSFKAKYGDFSDDKLFNRQFAADYAINQFLAHFNYTQLISGDPALHGKSTIDKTWVNYNKRLAKDIAPGLDGNFSNTKYNTIFLKDLGYTSKHFNEYRDVLGERADAYKNINPADAQEYTTLKEHLAVMEAFGKLTPLLKAAGERLMAGGEDSFDVDLILQPMKPVYVGTMVDKAMGIDRMYYIKTSSFPLIPSLTKGLEIDKLRVAMETGEIDRAVYESGTKLGLPINNIVDTEDSQGVLKDNMNLKSNAITLDRDGFRLQQEVPYHEASKDATANEGSQGRKLILSDVEDDDKLNLFNKEFTGKEAKQLYEDLHIEKMDRAFSKLLSDIGANKNGKIKDLSKLQKILLDEATSRNYNINDVYGLQIETVDGKQRFKIPLGFNNSSSRLESIMNSLFTNRVIKSELPGFSKIQGSSAGFSKLRTIDQLNNQSKEGIIWLDPKDTELNYIRKSKDGKFLLQADILVPSWFVDNEGKLIDITKFLREDGTLDTDKLPEDLLSTIGIRIPTQGYGSMMSFKVKGFLPKSVGDLAIVPAEIVAQMGSDFDVDKLFMYRYHYNFDGDKLTKINPDINKNISDFSNEEIDNSIIQYYEDRYKDVSLLPKILEPNGYGNLPDLAKEVNKLQGLDSDNHFFTTIKQNEFHKNNNDGIAGRGIFSLFSTFVRAAQDAKLKLNESVIFKVGENIVRSNTLYGKGHIEGKSPLTVIQYLQSASVDNAKEQLLGYLNINPITMDVAGTIAMTGFDENTIGYFLSQPILREYVDMLSNSNDITNPVFKSNIQRESEILEALQKKYLVEEEQLREEKIFSNEDLKAELKEPTNLNQRKVLEQYLSIKESAKQIRMLQNAVTTDTNGLGVRYVDLQVKENNINLAKYSSQIINANKLFERTQIGRASEIVSDALKLYSNILPYNTESYKAMTNSILLEMGKADKSDINARDLKSMYDTAKSYIYSTKSLLDIPDVNAERNKLLFGSQALGNRWEAYIKTPAGKKNLLSERILVRRGNTKGDPIRLEALNTPAANSSDNSDAMASYYRMYYKGTDEEKQLAKDIVNYFVLTGAKQGPNSISKYIPYDVLEAHDFSNKLHAIDKDLRGDTNYILSGTTEQFFQHYPSNAIAFDIKDKQIHDYKKEGFILQSHSTYQIADGKGHLIPPTYMSVYSKGDKDFLLYKIAESTPKGNRYSRIDLLGDKGLDEYNANEDAQYSIIKGNQVNLPIPADINKKVEEDTSEDKILDVSDKPKEATVVDKDFLTNHFNLDNTNPESTLNTIANSGSKELADIANDLKRVLINFPSLKIDTNEDREGVSGKFSGNTISINLDNILARNTDAIEATSRTIIHEVLHGITSWKINNYDKLSDTDKKLVDKIKILYNQYKRTTDQQGFNKLNRISKDLKEGIEVNEEDRQWFRENKSEFYPLVNIHEFIAAGLTQPEFVQKLKDNNFWDKLWKAISDLLGLNESYKNDYDALYNTALDLGKTDRSGLTQDEVPPLEDLSPRDAKNEFLTKYHLYDGKPITAQNFDRINSSMKANDKYKNIRIDLAWENGKRVLRVFTKGGTPLYDINPEIKPEKSKEEKIVDKSLKRLYDIRSKFTSNPNFNKNVSLQAKVEAINEQIKQIKEEKNVAIITSQAKDKLASIQTLMDREGKMSAYDIEETKRYLSWYANIRDYINYNEAFEEENKNLDEISRKAISLNLELNKKKLETFTAYVGSELDIKVDPKQVFTSPNMDVGTMESTFESGMFSSNQKLQILQSLIRKSQLKINDDFNKYQDEIIPVFKEYQKKYKDYNNLLQLDKNGKPTGRLLNKYVQEYYDKKKYTRDDFKVEITDKNKEAYDTDIKTLIEDLPDWNKKGTHDYAAYNQWFMSHDPEQYLAKVKKGMFISKEERAKFKDYVTTTPSDKWLDPRYKALKKFGEDSVEMKVYRELDTQFRSMSRLYNNEANYIPEIKKDFLDRVMHGDWKGAYGQLTRDMQDAVTTKVEPVINSDSLDINGVPNEAIPVYMMSNIMNSADKSYDLGRVLLFAKLQDFMLEHKNTVEPYLQMGKELALAQPQLITNTSGQEQVDQDGNVLLDHSPGRSPNLTAQANYMLDSYLYDKTTEQAGASKTARITRETLNAKGKIIKETRALTNSKIIDAVSNYTRLKALGLNPVSAVGRIIWGVVSNTIYAGDRKAYGEREAIKSLRTILEASLPGTAANHKVHALAEYFDMRQQLGEIKFGKFKLNSINNPLAEATPYVLVNKTEDFIQHQTGIAVLMKQKVADLSGNQRDLYDAFDNEGKWKTKEFGPNPYDNDKERLNMSSYIQSTVTAVHGDYGDATLANKNYILRNLLTMRKWLPRSMAVRFGKEYIDLQGQVQKGRYKSYNISHINPLNLIKDMYKAFTIDPTEDNIDARNLRMNAYELAFIPVLWGVALGLKALVHGIYHDDDAEKAAMTFLLNSTTRVSGDLTFFFNPYSFQSTIREPIPAFKTIMDFYDLGPAVLQTVEGKGTYKTGIHKGESKLAVKLTKAVPLINQPEKAYSAVKQELIDR